MMIGFPFSSKAFKLLFSAASLIFSHFFRRVCLSADGLLSMSEICRSKMSNCFLAALNISLRGLGILSWLWDSPNGHAVVPIIMCPSSNSSCSECCSFSFGLGDVSSFVSCSGLFPILNMESGIVLNWAIT